MKTQILCGLALLLAGCATPYAAKGPLGGYTEVMIEPHIDKVAFNGNGNTSEEKFVNYWLYRRAESTLNSGYRFFGLLTSPRTSSIPEGFGNDDLLPTERVNQASFARDADGRDALKRQVRSGPSSIYVSSYGGGSITTWRKEGTIVMFHERDSAT